MYIVTNVARNFRIRYFQKRICNVENLEIIDGIVKFPCESVKLVFSIIFITKQLLCHKEIYRLKLEQQRTTKASWWNPKMGNRVWSVYSRHSATLGKCLDFLTFLGFLKMLKTPKKIFFWLGSSFY